MKSAPVAIAANRLCPISFGVCEVMFQIYWIFESQRECYFLACGRRHAQPVGRRTVRARLLLRTGASTQQ